MECPNGYTLSLSARAPEHTTPGLIDYELSAISSARYVQAYKHHRRINGRSNVRLPDSPGHHPNENLRRSSRTETTQMEVERRTVKHFIEMSWGNKTNFSLWCTIYDRGNNTPKLRIQQKQNWPNVFLIPWTNLPSSRINLLLFLTLFSFRDPSSWHLTSNKTLSAFPKKFLNFILFIFIPSHTSKDLRVFFCVFPHTFRVGWKI